MSQLTFLTLPKEIRYKIYEAAGVKMDTLDLTEGSPKLLLNSEEGAYFSIPGQLLGVCRSISEEAAPLLYSKLRIWTRDLYAASNFLRTIGAANASFVRDLRAFGVCFWCPLLMISRWLREDSDVLHHLKVTQIEHRFTFESDSDQSTPMLFLQRMTNILYDDPEWASHRMRCKGFEDTGPDRWEGGLLVGLIKA